MIRRSSSKSPARTKSKASVGYGPDRGPRSASASSARIRPSDQTPYSEPIVVDSSWSSENRGRSGARQGDSSVQVTTLVGRAAASLQQQAAMQQQQAEALAEQQRQQQHQQELLLWQQRALEEQRQQQEMISRRLAEQAHHQQQPGQQQPQQITPLQQPIYTVIADISTDSWGTG